MRERELGWHLIFYNIKKTMGLTKSNEERTFLFFKLEFISCFVGGGREGDIFFLRKKIKQSQK